MYIIKSINYAEIFWLSDPLADKPFRLSPCGQDWLRWPQVDALFRGEWQPPEPVLLKVDTGRTIADILWTTFPPLLCISEKVVNLLLDNKCTGWSTYPVAVCDRQGGTLSDYFGLAVRHSVGRFQTNRSLVIDKPPMFTSKGSPWQAFKGMFFDESKWDGSDIFRVEARFIIVTEKAKDALIKARISNVYFTALSEMELNTLIFKIKSQE